MVNTMETIAIDDRTQVCNKTDAFESLRDQPV